MCEYGIEIFIINIFNETRGIWEHLGMHIFYLGTPDRTQLQTEYFYLEFIDTKTVTRECDDDMNL